MSIRIIANDTWRDCARVLATNGLDSAFADQDGVENMTGGARCLYYEGAGTNTLRAVYHNADGGLAADHCVVVRADRNLGHGVGVYSWAAYTGTVNVLFGATNFAEDLVGPQGTDFVVSFTALTNQEAFGVELNDGDGGSYSKVLQQVFFGTAFEIPYVSAPTRIILPKGSRLPVGRQSYHVSEEFQFETGKLSRDQADALQAIHGLETEPFFLYDPQGIQIEDNLLHVLLKDLSIREADNDLFIADLSFSVLEYYP